MLSRSLGERSVFFLCPTVSTLTLFVCYVVTLCCVCTCLAPPAMWTIMVIAARKHTSRNTRAHTHGHFPAELPFSDLMCVWGPDGIAMGGLLRSVSCSVSGLSLGSPGLTEEKACSQLRPRGTVTNVQFTAMHSASSSSADAGKNLCTSFPWSWAVRLFHMWTSWIVLAPVMFLCLLNLLILMRWHHVFVCVCVCVFK